MGFSFWTRNIGILVMQLFGRGITNSVLYICRIIYVQDMSVLSCFCSEGDVVFIGAIIMVIFIL